MVVSLVIMLSVAGNTSCPSPAQTAHLDTAGRQMICLLRRELGGRVDGRVGTAMSMMESIHHVCIRSSWLSDKPCGSSTAPDVVCKECIL